MRAALSRLRRGGLLLRLEGWRSVRDRLLDRLADLRRPRGPWPAWTGPPSSRPEDGGFPVLHLLGAPLERHLGGVQVQLLGRIREAGEEGFAVLHPSGDRLTLSAWSRGRRQSWELPLSTSTPAPGLRDPTGWVPAVGMVAEGLGCELLHVENAAGLPLETLLALQGTGLPMVLSVHDYYLFCRRTMQLLESPGHRFCGFSTELARCRRCLQAAGEACPPCQEEWRSLATEVLRGSEAVVYPSDFLRRQHLAFFPGLGPERQLVVEPTLAEGRARVEPSSESSGHVAIVGGLRVHKGSRLALEVARLAGDGPLRFTAFGGGDLQELHRARELGNLRLRGYYRVGALPRLLRRCEAGAALLLSIVPETYSLVLDECLLAGVPVVAFDHGAVGERIRRRGGGSLVPPGSSAEKVLEALRLLLDEGPAHPFPTGAPEDLWPGAPHTSFDALYHRLRAGDRA